jgi:hypothetical protein
MTTRSRSLTSLPCAGLFLFVAGFILAGASHGAPPCAAEGKLPASQGEIEHPDSDGIPATPDNPPPGAGVQMFADLDTTTAVSVTTTIGPDCTLLLHHSRPEQRQYGPGEQVVLEIHRGLATVNGATIYQPPYAPPPDWPLATLRRFSTIPYVRQYVDSHHGDSLRVWNDAAYAYEITVGQLNHRADNLYRALVRDGLPTEEIANRVRHNYESSPIVAHVTSGVLSDRPAVIMLHVELLGAAPYSITFADTPRPPVTTPPEILTTVRAAALRALIASLDGSNGPVAAEVGYGLATRRRR